MHFILYWFIGKYYLWELFNGQQWQEIKNDHIIECNYCQPGAKGITINTHTGWSFYSFYFCIIQSGVFNWHLANKVFFHFRPLYIDFDAMTLTAPFAGFAVRRISFLSHNQEEVMGWYYRDNSYWCEYGVQVQDVSAHRSLFITKNTVSVKSLDISGLCTLPTQGSSHRTSSISCQDLERQYSSNPTGSFQFTAGNYSYIVDFSGNLISEALNECLVVI